MLARDPGRRVVLRLPRADGGEIVVTCARPFDEAVRELLRDARGPIVTPPTRASQTAERRANGARATAGGKPGYVGHASHLSPPPLPNAKADPAHA